LSLEIANIGNVPANNTKLHVYSTDENGEELIFTPAIETQIHSPEGEKLSIFPGYPLIRKFSCAFTSTDKFNSFVKNPATQIIISLSYTKFPCFSLSKIFKYNSKEIFIFDGNEDLRCFSNHFS
jgi:hypothetical protein